MRMRLLIICLLLTFSSGVVAQSITAQDDDDDYNVSLVKSALQKYGLGLSVIEKRVTRLGDRASIAMLKIFDENDLKIPEKVKAMLPVIRTAFSSPTLITIAEDRKPKVTLFLLRYLENEVKDSKLRAEITRLIKFVTEQAAAKPSMSRR